MVAVHKGAMQFDGAVEINGALVLDGTLDTNSTITFDGAVDFDAQVDITGATVDHRGRTVAANGALAIAGTDEVIILLGSSDANTKAATITAPTANASGGPRLLVILKARSSTGSYTIACTNISTAGTLTLDAAGEGAEFAWINGVLNVIHFIGGSTFA